MARRASKRSAAASRAVPRRHRKKAVGVRGARRAAGRVVATAGGLTVTEIAELRELRRQLEKSGSASPLRWNADPDDVQRSVARLVLTLVEFIRRLLERQAIRRMDARTLTPRQVDDVGRALMQLEKTIREIAGMFGLKPEDLNLDIGPAGKLM